MSDEMNRSGLLIVLSAASGTGKTTVAGELLLKNRNIIRSISATTRAPRTGEENGRDYFFIDDQTFDGMVERGEFLEWAHVYTHRYGTPKKFAYENVDRGKYVLLVIDVQGGQAVKKVCNDAVLLFLIPPSAGELKKRLADRRSDSAEQLSIRLESAAMEIRSASMYDYIVLNDTVQGAVDAIESILNSEKQKTPRMKKILNSIARDCLETNF